MKLKFKHQKFPLAYALKIGQALPDELKERPEFHSAFSLIPPDKALLQRKPAEWVSEYEELQGQNLNETEI